MKASISKISKLKETLFFGWIKNITNTNLENSSLMVDKIVKIKPHKTFLLSTNSPTKKYKMLSSPNKEFSSSIKIKNLPLLNIKAKNNKDSWNFQSILVKLILNLYFICLKIKLESILSMESDTLNSISTNYNCQILGLY